MKRIPDTKFWVEITNCCWCKGAVPVMSLPFEKGRGWEGGYLLLWLKAWELIAENTVMRGEMLSNKGT